MDASAPRNAQLIIVGTIDGHEIGTTLDVDLAGAVVICAVDGQRIDLPDDDAQIARQILDALLATNKRVAVLV